MKHFLFEDGEYKFNPQFRKLRKSVDSAAALSRLVRPRKRTKVRGKRKSGGGGGRGRIYIADTRQRCVAKAQYSGNMFAHKKQLGYIGRNGEKKPGYLTREGTGIDGKEATLFGTNLAEYEKNMVDKNYRIFLSPENGDRIDLQKMTEKFMAKLELQTGHKFYWEGACHYNTAHPHAHVLINGIDKAGNEFTLPPDVVKTFMRESARDICTAQIGRRTDREVALEKERSFSAARWTRYDDTLKDLCKGGFRPDISGLAQDDKCALLKRVDALCKLKVCKWEGNSYKFSSNWEEEMRAAGRYNTYLKARDLLDEGQKLKVLTGADGKITGKVKKIFKVDEDAADLSPNNNHALLIEGQNGKNYFVPLFKKPEMRDGKSMLTLKEGALITLITKENEKGRLSPLIYKANELNSGRISYGK